MRQEAAALATAEADSPAAPQGTQASAVAKAVAGCSVPVTGIPAACQPQPAQLTLGGLC